ncbi:MAG: hypothetical protein KF886_26280 [Candidatus Hydrogenedentes bacterium]|nr:hypothetical protein [Candidatus Hydrogenedentota bacterium]
MTQHDSSAALAERKTEIAPRRNGFSRPASADTPEALAQRDRIVQACLDSECLKAEVNYAERSGHHKILRTPRLYKVLDRDPSRDEHLVRVVFPAADQLIELGSVLAITCLYDLEREYNIYGHVICAGPGVNGLLKAVHAPMGSAHPRPGIEGERAIMHFVDWKRAEWDRFLIDELARGRGLASALYIENFWKALDRMFGGGYLLNCPDSYHWSA